MFNKNKFVKTTKDIFKNKIEKINKKPMCILFKLDKLLYLLCIIIFLFCTFNITQTKWITTSNISKSNLLNLIAKEEIESKNYIKWMEFKVPVEVLKQALLLDINSYQKEINFNWIELISYASATNWGKFEESKKSKDIDLLVERLKNGERLNDITKNLKLYSFYLETYSAVLSEFVGEFDVLEKDKDGYEKLVRKYGLKVFSPIAKNYSYRHYNDFGVARSYGYKRTHQGHDLFGNVGTPLVAIEDGYIEVIGWNVYGGWRIGIRSNDKKRYYYYAHLRKDHPFVNSLKEGDPIQAGDVLGYLGMTGYSTKENTNNISVAHLHLGLQVIFDESQKDGNNQIWVDLYNIIDFLEKNKMSVYKNDSDNEYHRSINIKNIRTD